jgi:hypothetical protein
VCYLYRVNPGFFGDSLAVRAVYVRTYVRLVEVVRTSQILTCFLIIYRVLCVCHLGGSCSVSPCCTKPSSWRSMVPKVFTVKKWFDETLLLSCGVFIIISDVRWTVACGHSVMLEPLHWGQLGWMSRVVSLLYPLYWGHLGWMSRVVSLLYPLYWGHLGWMSRVVSLLYPLYWGHLGWMSRVVSLLYPLYWGHLGWMSKVAPLLLGHLHWGHLGTRMGCTVQEPLYWGHLNNMTRMGHTIQYNLHACVPA